MNVGKRGSSLLAEDACRAIIERESNSEIDQAVCGCMAKMLMHELSIGPLHTRTLMSMTNRNRNSRMSLRSYMNDLSSWLIDKCSDIRENCDSANRLSCYFELRSRRLKGDIFLKI